MGKFLTPLRAEKLSERNWLLLEPLVYRSDTVGIIVVDAGFVTNFASVPRLPFMYMLFGGVGDEAAVLHDWLYRKEHTRVAGMESKYAVIRSIADKVLRGVVIECLMREARLVRKEASAALLLSAATARITAWAMWMGVRLGGASHWE